MNRFGKISSALLLGLVILIPLLQYFKYDRITLNINYWIVLGSLFILPILLGLLLKWERISNILNVLSILLCLSGIYELEFSENTNSISKIRLKNSIKLWINDNSYFPNSYQSCEFNEFSLIARPYLFHSGGIGNDTYPNNAPVRYYYIEDPKPQFEYAYYFIKHKYLLKAKSGSVDTITAYFEADTNFRIIDVQLSNETQLINIPISVNNEWREKYGNEKKNLALEINGNGTQSYYFRYFSRDPKEVSDILESPNGITDFKQALQISMLAKGVSQYILPYSNGKINGLAYLLAEDGDTSSIATYKDGQLNGIKVSFNLKKDTIEIQTYKEGKLDGINRIFKDGKLSAIVTFKDGVRNGITEEIYPNGIIGFKGNCINGKFYGLCTSWHINGLKNSEGVRVKGIDVGIWKTWDEKGKLIKTEDRGHQQLLDSIPKLQ